MTQDSINQRIKFLVDTLSPSARAFSEAISESPTNTFNYIGGRLVEPRAGYLSKMVHHFGNINAHWLLTGEGEPLTSPAEPTVNYQKKNKGNVVGTNHGIASQQQGRNENCEKELAAAQHTIALLTSQLQDKERLIRLYERQSSSPPH